MAIEKLPQLPAAPSKAHAHLAIIRNITYTSVFAVEFFLAYTQIVIRPYRSDAAWHIDCAKTIGVKDLLSSHPGLHYLVSGCANLFHISHECAGVFLLSLSLVLTVYVINRILTSSLGGLYSREFLLFISVTLILVSAIYLPFFNVNLYAGQGSPNTWHNPTQSLSKPLLYPVFHLFPVLLVAGFVGGKRRYYVLVSILLIAGTLVKPSFALAFLPACGLYVLLRHTKNRQAYLATIAIALPTVILMACQFLSTFHGVADAGIEVSFLTVMRMRTPNVMISVLLTTAFPLSLLLCCPRRIIKSNHLFLAWLLLGVALLQGACFVETGPRMRHGNFMWGYLIALHVVFIYSMAELLRWFKEADVANLWVNTRLTFVTTLFSLHLVSGAYYLGRMLSGYSIR